MLVCTKSVATNPTEVSKGLEKYCYLLLNVLYHHPYIS